MIRHLGILIAPDRARTVHNSDLQGVLIIVGFQGPHNSSQDIDFALLVDILITLCGSVLLRGVVMGHNLALHFL